MIRYLPEILDAPGYLLCLFLLAIVAWLIGQILMGDDHEQR